MQHSCVVVTAAVVQHKIGILIGETAWPRRSTWCGPNAGLELQRSQAVVDNLEFEAAKLPCVCVYIYRHVTHGVITIYKWVIIAHKWDDHYSTIIWQGHHCTGSQVPNIPSIHVNLWGEATNYSLINKNPPARKVPRRDNLGTDETNGPICQSGTASAGVLW